DAEIDEGRLDAGLQVDDSPFVDVADVVVRTGPFDVELFEQSIFNDRDPAFLRLRDVDQHFAFHACMFFLVRVGDTAATGLAHKSRREPGALEAAAAGRALGQ